MKIDIDKVKKIYLAGIGGIGLSALAYFFHNIGKEVVGSDLQASTVTDRLLAHDIEINFGQKESNVTGDIDLFLYSSALPQDHPELKKAKELGIPCFSYFQWLGILSKSYKTIAVAGTNGKTTTTAMIGLIMEKAGLDPTVIVGSIVPQWKSNFRSGSSQWLVVEACEWRAHMLELKPQMIVLTNIAEDHLDYYKNLKDIQNHFEKFVGKLPLDGVLVKNDDDPNSRQISFENLVSFGRHPKATYNYRDLKQVDKSQVFTAYKSDEKLSEIHLSVPGEYNVANAMAAISVCDVLGINRHQMWNALNEFSGTWRRFEIIGEYKSNLVISDYAHHPDAIRLLLKATKQFYPDKI